MDKKFENAVRSILDHGRNFSFSPSVRIETMLYLMTLKILSDNRKLFSQTDLVIPQNFDWDTIKNNPDPKILGQMYQEFTDQNFEKLQFLEFRSNMPVEFFSRSVYSISSIDTRVSEFKQLQSNMADFDSNFSNEVFDNWSLGIVRTISPLANFFVEVFDIQKISSIYDPTCGVGEELIAYARASNDKYIKYYGQDINKPLLEILTLRFLINGITNFQLYGGDTLLEPGFIDNNHLKTFDLITANLPLGIKNDADYLIRLENDPFSRFRFAKPSHEMTYNLVQHIIASMSETGRAIFMLPNGFLLNSNNSTRELRQNLLIADLIEAIIELPSGALGLNVSVAVNAIILNKQKSRKNEVLFVQNPPLESTVKRRRREITEAAFNPLLEILKNPDESPYAIFVHTDEIISQGGELYPSKFIKSQLEAVQPKLEELHTAVKNQQALQKQAEKDFQTAWKSLLTLKGQTK